MRGVLNFAGRWYSIPLLLAVWHLSVVTGLSTSRLLPPLDAVWRAWIGDMSNGVLLGHAGTTIGRAMAGYAIAVVAGVLLAAAMARIALFGRMFEPFFFFGYPVPKIALFPIFTFMFGIGTPSKVAFTALECLYPIVVTTYMGVASVQTRLIWTARNMGASEWTVFRRVIVPAVLPNIFQGMRIALPLSIIIVVVTEMIGDTKGLGAYVNIQSTRFRFANVYAGIVTIGMCGFMLDRALAWTRALVIRWENVQQLRGKG